MKHSIISSINWWWVRHAKTKKPSDDTIVGWSDLPIIQNHDDHFQKLAEILPRQALVLTSDLCRSTQTLEILSRYTPDLATSQTEPELREQNFGQWENRTYDEIQEQFPEYIEATHHNPASICPPDGESFKDVTTRVTRVIQRYHKTDNIPESSIVCVVHAGTIRAAISHALSLPPEKSLAFHLDHLSVTRIEYFASVDSWKIHYINRTV